MKHMEPVNNRINQVSVITGAVINKGFSPYIDEETETWWEYDKSVKGFVDTGIKAQGEKGEPGYTPIKGVDYADGKDGYTPQKGIDYFDGYTPQKGIDYFDGKDGRDGADGYTPIKGVDYFDGKDGINGKDGEDGYTPVKGKDYFTAEEVEAIESGASDKALEKTYTREVIDRKIEDATPKDYDSLKNEVTSNTRHLVEVDTALANKVEKEDGKGLFSGDYNDLTNKPTIPPPYDDTELKEDLAKLDRTALYIDSEGYICLKESE